MRITYKITCRGFTKWVKSIIAYFVLRRETGITKVPSPSLRFRVHSAKDLYTFLEVGKQCAADIKTALTKNNIKFVNLQNILDFGCGCGRTLIYLTRNASTVNFYGTDIDAEAISWCKSNLKNIKWNVNNVLPPLPYKADFFDLVYAISVFTHLNEEYQLQWIEELNRIMKPTAALLISINGTEREGFSFTQSNFWKNIYPEWYGDAHISKSYIRGKYARYFKIVDYIPRGINNSQDLVVLRHNGAIPQGDTLLK